MVNKAVLNRRMETKRQCHFVKETCRLITECVLVSGDKNSEPNKKKTLNTIKNMYT